MLRIYLFDTTGYIRAWLCMSWCLDQISRLSVLYWVLQTFFFFFPRWYLQTVVLVYYIITVSSLILISLAYFQVLVIFDGSSFVPIQSHVTVSYIFSIPGLWIAEPYIWNKEDERPYLLTSHTAQHLWIQNAYCSEI